MKELQLGNLLIAKQCIKQQCCALDDLVLLGCIAKHLDWITVGVITMRALQTVAVMQSLYHHIATTPAERYARGLSSKTMQSAERMLK